MTLLFLDGFEMQDTAVKWAVMVSGGGTAVYDYAETTRFGSGVALKPGNSVTPGSNSFQTVMVRGVTPSAELIIGSAVKIPPTSPSQPSGPFHAVGADAGSTWHLYLTTTAAGAVQVWRGDARSTGDSPNGTMIATSAAGVIDSNWHYVEMSATIDSSAGTVVVRVDNNQVVNFTGNTRNGGTSTNPDSVAILMWSNHDIYGTYSPSIPVIDDLYVANGLGTVNNSFLGDLRVEPLIPDAAGSSTGFTPVGGANNWANVSAIPENPADYNTATTAGTRDTYLCTHLATTAGTIAGVQQVTTAYKTDAGTASIKAAQKSGATVSYGATRGLSTTAYMYTDIFETNPATSAAYTISDANALEIGAEAA